MSETMGVTNNPASFGVKNVQKTTFEAAEMILGPWNQQICFSTHSNLKALKVERFVRNPHLSPIVNGNGKLIKLFPAKLYCDIHKKFT